MRGSASMVSYWRGASPSLRLILITVGTTLALWFVKVVLNLVGLPTSWLDVNLALPGSLYSLGLRPWTLFTYMWSHNALGHLVINMLLLYTFGRMFLAYFTKQQFYALYILGGMVGGLFYPLFFSALDAMGQFYIHLPLYGSSAAILSLVVAVGFYRPFDRVRLVWVGRVPYYVIALLFVFCSLLLNLHSNIGGSVAHLGGGFLGLLFARLLHHRVDMTVPVRYVYRSVHALFCPSSWVKRPKRTSPPSETQEKQEPIPSDDVEIDEILAKVKRSGYSALTEEERARLFRR